MSSHEVPSQPGSSQPGSSQSVPVEVALAGRDPELLADELFALGASAVLEREASLVADLCVDTLERLGRLGTLGEHRVLENPGPVMAPVTDRPVGRRLRLVPAGSAERGARTSAPLAPHDDVGDGRVRVVLEAGGAFGSGSHPSTRLCLAALEPLAPRAGRVLDVGCGTGVLGAAALVLGAGSLTAVDVDAEALRVTASVLARNGVAGRAEVSDRPVEQIEGTFDLVLANLLVPIVESLGGQLVERVAPGGALVVGGILLGQRDRALAALTPLVPRVAHVESDWWTAVLTHPPAGRSRDQRARDRV